MLEKRAPKAAPDQPHEPLQAFHPAYDRPEPTTPLIPPTPFGQYVASARKRQARYQPLLDQLGLALRIAEAPEAIDRATIPLDLTLGPAKLKELGALVRLSPYLKAELQSLLAFGRADRLELKRMEKALALEAEQGMVAGKAAISQVNALYSWLSVARERFREHPAFYSLLSFDYNATELLARIARDVPTELADLFTPDEPAPPEPDASAAPEPPALSLAERTSLAWSRFLVRAGLREGAPDDALPDSQDDEDLKSPEMVLALMSVPPLTLELGLELVPLVDPSLGGELMERVIPMRIDVALDVGFVMPGVQFKDNMALPPTGYQVLVRGRVAARGEVMPGFLLAIQELEADTDAELVGFRATEPIYGREALWIRPSQRAYAIEHGYSVLDATDALVEHLDEAVRASAYEVLSFEELKIMLEKTEERAPTVVKHLMERMDFAELHQVLRALLRERVSIRDLPAILERLGHLLVFPRSDGSMGGMGGMMVSVHLDASDQAFGRNFERIERAMPRPQAPLDTPGLIEALRQALARDICAELADATDTMDVVTITSDLEAQLIEAVVPGREARALALSPQLADRVLFAFTDACRHLDVPIVICDARLRPALKRFTARALPRLYVLSHAELHPQYRTRTIGTIGWEASRHPER